MIEQESFLEYINIFLNTGELPNLFARDELDGIYGECSIEFAKSPYARVGEDPTQVRALTRQPCKHESTDHFCMIVPG